MTDTTLTEPLAVVGAPGSATAAVPQQAFSLGDAAAAVGNNLADYWWAYLIGIGFVIVVWMYRKVFRDAAVEERHYEEQRAARSARWQAKFETTKQTALKDALESIAERLKADGVLGPQDRLSPDAQQRITADFNRRHPSELKRALLAKDEKAMVRDLFAWMRMPPKEVLEALTGRVTPFHPGKPGFVDTWTETLTNELWRRRDQSHSSDRDLMKPVASGVEHALEARIAQHRQDRDEQLASVEEALGRLAHHQEVTWFEWLRADLKAIELSDPTAKEQLELTRERLKRLREADARQIVPEPLTRKENMENLDRIQAELDDLAKVPEAEWNPPSGETWATRKARLEQQRTARAEQEKNAQLSEIDAGMTALGARLAIGENMEETKEYESLLTLSMQVNAIDPSDPRAREQLSGTAAQIANLNRQLEFQSQPQAGSLAQDRRFKAPRAENDVNEPREEKPVGPGNPKDREREHLPEH